MLCKNKSINLINLWLKTIQHPPVLQAGDDLELSVSSFRKKVAECHHCVVINLEEYQWNRKRNGLYEESSSAKEHTNTHFLCCGPKPCDKNLLMFILSVCSVFTLHPPHPPLNCSPHIFQKREYSLLPRKWPTGLTSSPYSLFSQQLSAVDWSFGALTEPKKGIWVTLLEGAKLKLASNPTELFVLNSQSLLVIVEWRAAPSHLCRPLQHSESMSQKYIKIVSTSHHKSKHWGFTSTHFLITTVTQLQKTLLTI